jgi:hypothetical protein
LLFNEIENPLANDFLDEIYVYNFEKAFETEAAKENLLCPITNADIIKECEKSKAEIMSLLKAFTERQENLRVPSIIQKLIDAGQLRQAIDEESGKYLLLKTIPKFFDWCLDNGFGKKINATFVAEYIKTDCSLETLKRYEREARNSF